MKNLIKRLIIMWSIKQIKNIPENASYGELDKFFIADIMKNKKTGESMYIFD